jgi:hypothetical protein
MDKYQDYVRAVRELGLQPLRVDEFESLTGVMSMSEIINLTAKKSGTDREELAEGTKMASMDENEKEFMRLVEEFMEQGFSQQEAIDAARDELERKSIDYMADGGRVNYGEGTKKITLDDTPNFELEDLPKLLEEFELDLGRPPVSLDELKRHFKNKYGSDRLSKKETEPMMMASAPDMTDSLNDLANELFGKNLDLLTEEEMDMLRDEAERLSQKFMAKGGRVLKQTGGITETRTLPPEFIEAAQRTFLTDLATQAGMPSVTTATAKQPGETDAQFAQRQAQAQQFGITKAGMADLAPKVADESALQVQARGLAGGLGSFQPFLTKAGTAADAATALTGTGAGTGAGSIQSYMSPYQQQVIDTTMAEFDRQAQIRANQQAAATLGVPGAFGGGREGVQRAEYQAASDRNRAQTFANLQQQGFQNAAARRQQDLANQMGISNLQGGLGARAQDFSRAQISGLGTLGAAQQAQNQAVLDAQRQAAQMAIDEPRQALARFGQGIAGITPGAGAIRLSPAASEAPQASPLMKALGLGLAGADIYGRIF